MEYVIDASVVVKWFLPEPHTDKADILLNYFLHRDLRLIAPDLIVAEVVNTLWKRSAVTKEISSAQAQESCIDFLNLGLPLEPCSTMAEHALNFATQEQHAVYDAFYVVLALRRGCELITADRTLVSKVGARHPQVQWLGSLRLSEGKISFL